MKRGEEGAALLTVLLLVAIMAVLSAAALEKLSLSTRLAANAGAIDQARGFAIAAEGIAVGRIGDLVAASPDRTTLAGGWNGRETRLPLPGGIATATVRDGGNCFNLNSVAQGRAGEPIVVRPTGITQFTALMKLLGIDEGTAANIAASLADWIDSDTTPLPGGGEDQAYAGLPVPYRTGNTLLADSSELRAVAGVTPEIYDRLRPWICALPVTDLSPINVNTLLPEQAILFAMLLPDKLTVDQARAILARRPAEGYGSIFDFWNSTTLSGLTPAQDVKQQTVFRTRWFALSLKVRLGDTELDETALIDAQLAPAKLVRRSWGEGA